MSYLNIRGHRAIGVGRSKRGNSAQRLSFRRARRVPIGVEHRAELAR
jgi:hypothetical protein